MNVDGRRSEGAETLGFFVGVPGLLAVTLAVSARDRQILGPGMGASAAAGHGRAGWRGASVAAPMIAQTSLEAPAGLRSSMAGRLSPGSSPAGGGDAATGAVRPSIVPLMAATLSLPCRQSCLLCSVQPAPLTHRHCHSTSLQKWESQNK